MPLDDFAAAIRRENHTIKRVLTDPHVFSGIGNAYSDEILHAARLSPLTLSQKLTDEEIARLFDAMRATLLRLHGYRVEVVEFVASKHTPRNTLLRAVRTGSIGDPEVATEYARLTGRDVSRIGYYMAFGYFKLAAVLEGIHARYQQGKTVGEGFEQEGFAVPLLIARAHEVLDAESSRT